MIHSFFTAHPPVAGLTQVTRLLPMVARRQEPRPAGTDPNSITLLYEAASDR